MDDKRSVATGPTPKKLFIGIGNEFRGDDGVGPFLARELGRLNLRGIRVIEQGGEGTDLIAAWEGADFVILADAVVSGGRPGEIFRFELPGEPLPKAIFSRQSTHAFGLFEAIGLSETLGTLPARMVIFGIEGAKFEAGAGLSPDVEAAAGAVLAKIIEEIG